MIVTILLELIKVLQVMYEIIIDRVGISEDQKNTLIVSFANFKQFVNQFSHDNPNNP